MSLAAGSIGAWEWVDLVADLGIGKYTESKESRNAGFTESDSSTERCFLVQPGVDNSNLTAFVDDLLGFATWDAGTSYVPGGGSAFATASGTISYGTPVAGNSLTVFGPPGCPLAFFHGPVMVVPASQQFTSGAELAALISGIPGLAATYDSGTNEITITVTIEGTAPAGWSIVGGNGYPALNITFSGGGTAAIRRGLNRVLPDQHSIFKKWYCTKVRVEGEGTASLSSNIHKCPVWDLYRVWAYYQPVDYKVADDAAVRVDGIPKEYQRFCRFPPAEPNIEILQGLGSFRFVNEDGTPGRVLASAPGILHATTLFTIEWLKVPQFDKNSFANPVAVNDALYRGTLNARSFLGYQEGTVLYLGCTAKMVTPAMANDVFYWNITFKFSVKWNNTDPVGLPAKGHNYLFDATQGKWLYVTHDGTPGGIPIYQQRGYFYELWQPR